MSILLKENGGMGRINRFVRGLMGLPRVIRVELTAEAVSIDGTAAGFGGVKLFDFADIKAGREWLIMGIATDLVFTTDPAGTIDDDAAAVGALGTVLEAATEAGGLVFI